MSKREPTDCLEGFKQGGIVLVVLCFIGYGTAWCEDMMLTLLPPHVAEPIQRWADGADLQYSDFIGRIFRNFEADMLLFFLPVTIALGLLFLCSWAIWRGWRAMRNAP